MGSLFATERAPDFFYVDAAAMLVTMLDCCVVGCWKEPVFAKMAETREAILANEI